MYFLASGVRLELLQHLLQLHMRENQSLIAERLAREEFRRATRHALAEALDQPGGWWDTRAEAEKRTEKATSTRVHQDAWESLSFLSQRMEGFCLADFKVSSSSLIRQLST